MVSRSPRTVGTSTYTALAENDQARHRKTPSSNNAHTRAGTSSRTSREGSCCSCERTIQCHDQPLRAWAQLEARRHSSLCSPAGSSPISAESSFAPDLGWHASLHGRSKHRLPLHDNYLEGRPQAENERRPSRLESPHRHLSGAAREASAFVCLRGPSRYYSSQHRGAWLAVALPIHRRPGLLIEVIPSQLILPQQKSQQLRNWLQEEDSFWEDRAVCLLACITQRTANQRSSSARRCRRAR